MQRTIETLEYSVFSDLLFTYMMEQEECVLVHEDNSDPSDSEIELDERIQRVQDSSDMDR